MAWTKFAVMLFGFASSLGAAENGSGWRILFDGKTMKGWRDPSKLVQPGDAWAVEDGCLTTRLKPRIAEDLISEDSFGDFELVFDWKVPVRGNTGVKYRIQRLVFVDHSKIQRGPGGFEAMLGREIANHPSDRAKLAEGARAEQYSVGFEMQLIDDAAHPDARKDRRHITGALYSMIAPTVSAAKPPGEWNSGKIVLKGDRFEHWINEQKVLEGTLSDPRVREGCEKRWGPAPEIREALTHPKPAGPICLQHHGDKVWFRNIRIRVTDAR